MPIRLRDAIFALSPLLLLTAMTGCGIGVPAGPVGSNIQSVKGLVHGGQSPIQGSTVKLYHTDPAATAYGAAGIFIGSAVTDVNGSFSIASSSFSGTGSSATSANCPAGTQAYINAAGGYQPGLSSTVNNNLLMVAALGDCANVSATTNVIINELTTVAAAYALSGFTTTTADGSTGYYKANIGAPAANNASTSSITATTPAGLAHAFMNAASLVNSSTGAANTTITANTAGATTTGAIPATELNTLGDIMQSCVNTTSSAGSLSTGCSSLFGFTPSISGATPTNTLQAFVYLARNPYPSAAAMNSTTGLLSLSTASGAFQPTLSAAPTDWSVAIVYDKGLPAPYWLALDMNDTVYLGRSTTSSTTSALWGLSPYGLSVPLFASPSAGTASRGIAPDALGNIWLCDNGSAVDRFSTSTGSLLSTYATSGSCTPVAVDRQNNLWVGHVAKGAGSVIVDEAAYNSTSGTWALNYTVDATSAGNQGAYGIGIDANQNIWSAGYYQVGTTEDYIANLGTAASPSYTTSGTVITPITATVGTEPYSTVFDASGNGWVSITGSNSTTTTGIQEVVPNATIGATSLTPGSLIANATLNADASQQIAIDGAGTLFIPDNNNSTTQGIHVYQTTTGTVLTPSTSLRSTAESVTSVTVNNGGAGCTSAPAVSFTGGGGSGAVGTATLGTGTNSASVASVAVTSVGSGYTTAPTVVFTGGGCTTTPTATATVLAVYNPRQIAVDSTGSIWAGFTIGGVTQIIGIAAPSYPLLSAGKPGLSPGLTAVNPLP
jgi:hypothetical protein